MADFNIYESEAEHLYFKLVAALDQLTVESDAKNNNILVDLVKKTQQDIKATGDRDYIMKADALILADDDQDEAVVKKSTKTMVICVLALILCVAGTIVGSIFAHNWTVQSREARDAEIEAEFGTVFDRKLAAIKNETVYKETHAKVKNYEITDIKLFNTNQGIIYVNVDYEYDDEKYYSFVYDKGYIARTCGSMCERFENDPLIVGDWEYSVVGTISVNGKVYEESDEPYWQHGDDVSTYTDFDVMWIPFIAGLILIVVFIVVLCLNRKKMAVAKANMAGKTKLVMAKGKGKKTAIKLLIVLIVAGLAVGGFFAYRVVQQHRAEGFKVAEQLLAKEDYEGALEEYQSLGHYKDSAEMAQILEDIQSDNFDDAIAVCDTLSNDRSKFKDDVIEMRNAYYYEQASKSFEKKEFDEAKEYLSAISGYKDADQMLKQMDNYIKYYDALEYESESISGAVKIYKTLPADFLDVSKRIEKYEPYVELIGGEYICAENKYMKEFEIEDFFIDEDKSMKVRFEHWEITKDEEKIYPSQKDGYLFTVRATLQSGVQRIFDFSADSMTLTYDGEVQFTYAR